jgi:hypothetical protein
MIKRYSLYVQLLIMRNCITAELVKGGISSSAFLLKTLYIKTTVTRKNFRFECRNEKAQ